MQCTFVWSATAANQININGNKTAAAPSAAFTTSRPASNHPGTAVVAYCDGHVRTLSQDINYNVLVQLMTPNGTGLGSSVAPLNGVVGPQTAYPLLNDGDVN